MSVSKYKTIELAECYVEREIHGEDYRVADEETIIITLSELVGYPGSQKEISVHARFPKKKLLEAILSLGKMENTLSKDEYMKKI